MILDKFLELSGGQTLSDTGASTNVIDFGQTEATTGMNDGRMKVLFTVNAAVTGDLIIKLQESADNSTFTDVRGCTTGALASPVAGTKVLFPMPRRHKRYIRAYYDEATGESATALSAGKISAHVVWGVDDNVPPAQAASQPVGQ